MEISKENFLKLPKVAGVYTFWKDKTPIYIGKSVNLNSRLNSYLSVRLGTKTMQMVSEANNLSFIEVTSDLESLLLESYLIKKHKPKYNILLKDDKHALYIVITNEEFPRVLSCRKLEIVDYKNAFGPFPSSTNVRLILRMIRKVFPFSDHKLGKKACLYSHLGLCNPCPNTITNVKDVNKYKKNIRNIKLVLSRKFNVVRNQLDKEMDKLSKIEKFEEAKVIRDKIKIFDYITQQKIETEKFLENPNMVEDIHEFEIKNLLNLLNTYSASKIATKFEIKNLHRIECFDVAHLSGSNPTASMVVLTDGEIDNSKYKHFNIRQKNSQSDYDSMREVATRRSNHLEDWGRPDLIIVDGGLGQVKIFDEVLKEFNVPVVGIAKHPDRLIFINGTKIKLQGLSLNLVTRIRDEAHRFARRLHHLHISKNLIH